MAASAVPRISKLLRCWPSSEATGAEEPATYQFVRLMNLCRIVVHSPSCSTTSNRHKMSDFEDLGFDDSELLTVACVPESTVHSKACRELGLCE